MVAPDPGGIRDRCPMHVFWKRDQGAWPMDQSARPASATPPPQALPDPLALLGLLETMALAGSPTAVVTEADAALDRGPAPVSSRPPSSPGVPPGR
jgi:hypothetical protein